MVFYSNGLKIYLSWIYLKTPEGELASSELRCRFRASGHAVLGGRITAIKHRRMLLRDPFIQFLALRSLYHDIRSAGCDDEKFRCGRRNHRAAYEELIFKRSEYFLEYIPRQFCASRLRFRADEAHRKLTQCGVVLLANILLSHLPQQRRI